MVIDVFGLYFNAGRIMIFGIHESGAVSMDITMRFWLLLCFRGNGLAGENIETCMVLQYFSPSCVSLLAGLMCDMLMIMFWFASLSLILISLSSGIYEIFISHDTITRPPHHWRLS